MLLLELAQSIYFCSRLSKTSKNNYLGLRTDEMSRFDSHNEQFWVKKKTKVTSCGLKVKIISKWYIPQIFEIVLESYYLTIIKRISNIFPSCTNSKMFFHIRVILYKEIFTIIALFNSTICNSLFSFLKLTYIASISHVNLVCKKQET